jgi:methyl-accepting chemotaxis protein
MDITDSPNKRKIRSNIIDKLENSSSKSFLIQMIITTIITYLCAAGIIVLIDLILYEATVGDINLLGFIGYFLTTSLSLFIPIAIISTILILFSTMPIVRMMKRHEKGEKVTKAEYFKARTRSARLPVIIFIVNIIFPIIISLIEGSFGGIISEAIIVAAKNISIFILAALVQNAIYQRILSKPRAIMKIYTVDTTTKNWFVKNIDRLQLYASAIFITAVLFHSSMSILQTLIRPDTQAIQAKTSAQTAPSTDVHNNFQKMREKMQAQVNDKLGQTTISEKETEQNGLKFATMYIVLILIVFGLIILVETIVRRARQTQTKILQNVLEELSEGSGDLTHRVLIVQADETGLLSHQLNKLLDKLQTMFRNISTQTNQVAESSSAISAVLEGTVAATEEMAASVNQINYNADRNRKVVAESQQSLENMLTSLNQINNNVNTQAAYVEQTSSAMTEMIANIQSVNEVTSKANEVSETLTTVSNDGSQAVLNSITAVRDIEESSLEVNNLVITISKILAQTNMLAMNAAIEAAHAGDAGRGFAVVAEEVRNLADDSSTNLKTISANMKDVLDKVNRGVNLSETAGGALKQVGEKTSQTTRLMSEVASAMQEQAAGANEVLNSIHSLVEASNSINKLSEDQQQNNDVMKENLERTVNAFIEVQSATSELAEGNGEIMNGIDDLKQVIMKNEDVVAALQNELSGYKL